MMKYSRLVFLTMTILMTSCADIDKAGSEFLTSKAQTYTLTNLHPDENKNKMYTTNFIQGGLIPRCSEVHVAKQGGTGTLKFKYNDTDYVYKLQSQTTPEGWLKNTKKYFGPTCDVGAVAKLSEIDQQGVREGKVLVGMSKQAVIYAIGYPPETETPDLNSDNSWKYWINRYTTFMVNFDQAGKVAQIQHSKEAE